MCACSLSYPACVVYAFYYIVIYAMPGGTIFFHIISLMTLFPGKFLRTKCVFSFSLHPPFLSYFNRISAFSTDFRKKRKFVQWEPNFPRWQTDGRTDRYEEANSRFSQFLRLCLKPCNLKTYSENIPICSAIHSKHINTLCGQKVAHWLVSELVVLVQNGFWKSTLAHGSGASTILAAAGGVTWSK